MYILMFFPIILGAAYLAGLRRERIRGSRPNQSSIWTGVAWVEVQAVGRSYLAVSVGVALVVLVIGMGALKSQLDALENDVQMLEQVLEQGNEASEIERQDLNARFECVNGRFYWMDEGIEQAMYLPRVEERVSLGVETVPWRYFGGGLC